MTGNVRGSEASPGGDRMPVQAAHGDREAELVAGLLAGDEAAFVALVEAYSAALLRLAMLHVPSRGIAEEVVQDTWLAVLQGIGGFEARSSLKTWITRILLNQARRRGERESRVIPFSALAAVELESSEPAVDPERFRPPDAAQWPGGWASPPHAWEVSPEEAALSGEIRHHLYEAVDRLPPAQRMVIWLRDLEGWTRDEVCNVLSISETNQRVLLHRARSKVRGALESYLEGSAMKGRAS